MSFFTCMMHWIERRLLTYWASGPPQPNEHTEIIQLNPLCFIETSSTEKLLNTLSCIRLTH